MSQFIVPQFDGEIRRSVEAGEQAARQLLHVRVYDFQRQVRIPHELVKRMRVDDLEVATRNLQLADLRIVDALELVAQDSLLEEDLENA